MSADYSEINELVSEFLAIESDVYVGSIKKEMAEVVACESWKAFVSIAYSEGGRILTVEKAKILLKYLCDLFEEKKDVIEPNFYTNA